MLTQVFHKDWTPKISAYQLWESLTDGRRRGMGGQYENKETPYRKAWGITASSRLQGMIYSEREYQCKLLQANFSVKCFGSEQLKHCTDTFSIRYWPPVTTYHSSPVAVPQTELLGYLWLLQGHCKLGYKSESITWILSKIRFWQENVLELTVTGERHIYPGSR